MTPEKAKQLLRFIAVGGINTGIDIALFSLLSVVFNFNVFVANMISTSAALAVSYVLNSHFTFKGVRTPKTLLMFILVTLSGLWLLQPLVIVFLAPLIESSLPFFGNNELSTIAAKLISILATLVWNYTWYSKVIFKTAKPLKESSHRQPY